MLVTVMANGAVSPGLMVELGLFVMPIFGLPAVRVSVALVSGIGCNCPAACSGDSSPPVATFSRAFGTEALGLLRNDCRGATE